MAVDRVTDMDAMAGDVVQCAWTDHDGQHTGSAKVTGVTEQHVTVLLETPLPGAAASLVVFPHESDVPGLRCCRSVNGPHILAEG